MKTMRLSENRHPAVLPKVRSQGLRFFGREALEIAVLVQLGDKWFVHVVLAARWE
jgi:hypothetical protein